MIHSTPDNDDGCEFADLFTTTPNDLIQDGLFKALAVAYRPGDFHHVSACLVARALGATDLKPQKGLDAVIRRCSSAFLGKERARQSSLRRVTSTSRLSSASRRPSATEASAAPAVVKVEVGKDAKGSSAGPSQEYSHSSV